MRKKDLKRWYWFIDQLDVHQMAKFKMNAPTGHPVFRNDLPLFTYFYERYNRLRKELGSSSSTSSSTSTMANWSLEFDPNDARHSPNTNLER